MFLILLIWISVFFVFYMLGFSVVKTINRIKKQEQGDGDTKPDELFFIGFLVLSSVVGLFSIFIPVGTYFLLCVYLLSLIIFLINFREIQYKITDLSKKIALLSKFELAALIFIIIFILTAVAQKITLGDTESYHAQSIQWIRKYAVVPGLGNIHGRLAFNSMFFVISGLFTFQIKDILIFPLNGICYLILIIKLFTLYKKDIKQGTRWKAVFYILTVLISLLIMLPNLNSPSPDIICAILIIYICILIMNPEGDRNQMNFVQIVLLNLMVFSCIAYKISSLLIILAIPLILKKDSIKKCYISFGVGILILSSFFIRNYFLSGYVIYPFPGIDIFNVDWKIPLNDVISMKLEIETWAKISTISSTDVANMKISEWILPWFSSLNFNNKMLITINIFSVITIIIMLFRKDYLLAKIQFVVLINLLFWLIMAPDPRFAYGFIFIGFSLTLAYMIKLLEYSNYSAILNYIKIGLACFLILIICRRIKFPVDAIRNPSLWFISAPFGTVETNSYFSDFYYRVPIPEGGCFNVEIPCVPYPLTNVILRGTDIKDGFKTIIENH
jgi:hypothetical protein